ncbi:hypothetical protein C7B64_20870 [Merismopedia glauca CCAP 1448/3]|uniref:DNA primase n=2 Tax=Merismopedia TaxID=53402 RepID=A0A2T1BYC1_9CYAN|nr:hypothetical protein C7B64_20870 [Merismopedia glauca CCAP 1448/3]
MGGLFAPDTGDWSEEKRREWSDRKLYWQHKLAETERLDRERNSLSIEARDYNIRRIHQQVGLSPQHRQNLRDRGLTDEQIDSGLFFSLGQWQEVYGIHPRLAGVNPTGSSLIVPSPGLACPIWNPDGQIIGYQTRLDNPGDGGKYKWPTSQTQKRPDGASSHLPNGELPITYCYGSNPDFIGLSEGILKPYIASCRLGVSFIGAAGGQWAASPQQLQDYLTKARAKLGTKRVVLFPDGGAIANSHVMRCYEATLALLESWGYSVAIAWWGQVDKSHPDCDELKDLSGVKFITVDEFLALSRQFIGISAEFNAKARNLALEPDPTQYQEYLKWEEEQEQVEDAIAHHGAIYRFKDFICKGLKRLAPKGFKQPVTPEPTPKPAPKIWDGDRLGMPTPEQWATAGRPVVEFSGENAQVWTSAFATGWQSIHDKSGTGSGKTHSVTKIGHPYSKAWYLSSDHRNPTIPAIEENFADLNPRSQHGFYIDETGKQRLGTSDHPGEGANCIRAELFGRLRKLNYPVEGENNPVCGTCPWNGSCSVIPGRYRHDRAETLSHKSIRAHLESLPRGDYDYTQDILILDEPTSLITPTRQIEATANQLLIEADRSVGLGNNDYFLTLRTLVHSLQKLLEKSIKVHYGITHEEILSALKPVLEPDQIDELIEFLSNNQLNLSEVFTQPDAVGSGDYRQLGSSIQYINQQFRKEAYRETSSNLDQLPPNALIYLLKALRGDRGIVLRAYGGLLTLTINRVSEYSQIFNTAKHVVLLDATSSTKHLAAVAGIDQPILTIRKKATPPLANLEVVAINLKGLKTNHPSPTALSRVKALLSTLKAEYRNLSTIGHKNQLDKYGLDGYWWRDSRGVNTFEGREALALIGSPYPNVGAIQDNYLALYGNLDNFDEFYQFLVSEEILQALGRQRSNLYQDRQFKVFYIATELDLDFLKKYGATITYKQAFEICPEAGEGWQIALDSIIKALAESGARTQTQIAQALGKTQQAISKALREAGVTLSELMRRLEILLKRHTTNPIDSLYRVGCITEPEYLRDQYFRELFELPPLELVKTVIAIIEDLGWRDFRELFLDDYPKPLQIKALSSLTALLSDLELSDLIDYTRPAISPHAA